MYYYGQIIYFWGAWKIFSIDFHGEVEVLRVIVAYD